MSPDKGKLFKGPARVSQAGQEGGLGTRGNPVTAGTGRQDAVFSLSESKGICEAWSPLI